MTSDEATKLVRTLFAAYPQAGKLTRETAAVYAADLTAFGYEETKRAIAAARKKSHYLPTIAEILDEIVRVRMQHLPDWTGAWELLEQYAEKRRLWRERQNSRESELSDMGYDVWLRAGRPSLVPKPEPPPAEVLAAADVIGGVNAIYVSGNLAADRAHFRDAYQAILARIDRELRESPAAVVEDDAAALTEGGP